MAKKKKYPRSLAGCRLYTNCKDSFCAFHKSLESGAVLGSDEVSTANICPTDAVRPVVLLLHLEEVNGRIQIPRLDFMASRNERLQRNDLTAFFHIQEMVNQFVIELWCESLVVDENNVSPLQDSDDVFFREEVTPRKMCFTRRDTPEAASGFELGLLEIRKIAGILHHFATPAFAADF